MNTSKLTMMLGYRRTACAAMLLLAACGKTPTMHYYDLRYPSVSSPSQADPKYPKTLAISGFTAASLYRQSRVIYREGSSSNKVGYYEDRRWASPPTELLTQAALTHFRNARLFADVIPFSDRNSCDYVLRARIIELEEIDMADGFYGRVTLQAELLTANNGRVLWSGAVSANRKTSTRDANAVVEEIAGSAKEALAELAQAIDQALARAGVK